MKILVTGANGYLGQGIVRHLLDQGHNVVATGRKLDNWFNLAFVSAYVRLMFLDTETGAIEHPAQETAEYAVKLVHIRQAAVSDLHSHLNLPEESEYLWKCVIAFEGYVFSTSGRGKDRKGSTRFKYAVSRSSGTGGRHYAGMNVEGFGNEIFVEGKEKSISRSTMDLALKKAKALNGKVKGPKALGLPGSGSYLYPMLVRFKLIEAE